MSFLSPYYSKDVNRAVRSKSRWAHHVLFSLKVVALRGTGKGVCSTCGLPHQRQLRNGAVQRLFRAFWRPTFRLWCDCIALAFAAPGRCWACHHFSKNLKWPLHLNVIVWYCGVGRFASILCSAFNSNQLGQWRETKPGCPEKYVAHQHSSCQHQLLSLVSPAPPTFSPDLKCHSGMQSPPATFRRFEQS